MKDPRQSTGGDAAEPLLHEAAALADEGRWREAFDLLREQEADHPEHPLLLAMLGTAARELGAEGVAYEFFRRCLAQQPADPMILATAGTGLAAFDDPEAESALRLAALTAPHSAFTRLRYGSYLVREGLFDAAIDELEAARGLDEENELVRVELGTAYLLAGRWAEGVAELGEALQRDPSDSWIRALYALALLEAEDTDEAAEELHRVSAERPEDGEIQLLAALSAAAQEWEDEAWNALARAEAALDVDPALIREVEEGVEAGPEVARALLRDNLATPALRSRLLERP